MEAAARPAAAPAATSKRNRSRGRRAILPMVEATMADSCTIAHSRPMEPPEATVTSEEADLTRLWRTLIQPSPTVTASI